MTYFFTLAKFPEFKNTQATRDVVADQYKELGVIAGAVVERDAAGGVHVREQGSSATFGDLVSNSAIGAVVGLLIAGPAGAATGAAVGGAGTGLTRAFSAHDVVQTIGQNLKDSRTGLILQTTSAEHSHLDSVITSNGGTVTRFTDEDL